MKNSLLQHTIIHIHTVESDSLTCLSSTSYETFHRSQKSRSNGCCLRIMWARNGPCRMADSITNKRTRHLLEAQGLRIT
ncbi:unnamed protein product [Calypogeia fissa]